MGMGIKQEHERGKEKKRSNVSEKVRDPSDESGKSQADTQIYRNKHQV